MFHLIWFLIKWGWILLISWVAYLYIDDRNNTPRRRR